MELPILKPGSIQRFSQDWITSRKICQLRQQKPLKVYRDGDLDNEYDLIEENVKEGIYGINIHRNNHKKWVVNPQGLINGR